MSERLKDHMQRKRDADRESHVADMPDVEKRAHAKWLAEAEAAGATVNHAELGDGGLPPSLVLGVMRRDKYTCKLHGDKGEEGTGGLEVHHKSGFSEYESVWQGKKGHGNDPNNIVTLCKKAHDEIHERAREEEKREGVSAEKVIKPKPSKTNLTAVSAAPGPAIDFGDHDWIKVGRKAGRK